MGGSYAKDTCTADSDYDFYIIMPDEGGVAGERLCFMERDALVKEWFRYARMDIASAKVLMETMYPAPLEIICYHCQQTAEKVLKGLLVTVDDNVEKTHDLVRLLNKQ